MELFEVLVTVEAAELAEKAYCLCLIMVSIPTWQRWRSGLTT